VVDGVEYLWQNAGNLELDFAVESSSSSIDGSSTDGSSTEQPGATAYKHGGSSSSRRGSRLLPTYKSKNDLKGTDWVTSSSKKGLIERWEEKLC
jgi:hypothetical protein